MNEREQAVSDHYTVSALEDRIMAGLDAAGADLSALTVDDLAPVDAFHIRGRAATEELAAWVGLSDGQDVLDIGSGIGGTARFLASRSGAHVTGIDLTDEYCRVATSLSARVGLAERTSFTQGSALELPFEDARFDVCWTEHVQMNIADKVQFYAEAARVLRPGGRLAFHDIFAGATEGLRVPVPWATDITMSHLASVDEVERILADLDLTVERWEERTDESMAFFTEAMARMRDGGPAPLGIHLLMAETAGEKLANVLHNLESGRIRVVQAIMRRSS